MFCDFYGFTRGLIWTSLWQRSTCSTSIQLQRADLTKVFATDETVPVLLKLYPC